MSFTNSHPYMISPLSYDCHNGILSNHQLIVIAIHEPRSNVIDNSSGLHAWVLAQ